MTRLIVLLALLLSVPLKAAAQRGETAPRRLDAVRSWGYQLQKIDPKEVAASPYDLVVIDYSRNGTDAGRFTPAELKAMQTKPGGGRRIVLAYMSIGEAEDYRFYWQRNWVEPAPLKKGLPGTPGGGPGAGPNAAIETVRIPRLVAPGWLGRENEVWSGNYLVRYWYDGWQSIVMHNDDSYLARVQQAGFDGVYLDRVDAYYAVEGDRRDAARRMVDLVIELAGIARGRKPGFIVVPQNGEELLGEPRYVAAIDGVAKEDLLFSPGGGEPSPAGRLANTMRYLQLALDAGRPVLAVEYVEAPEKMRAAESDLRGRGFVPLLATRKLDRIGPVAGDAKPAEDRKP